MEPASGPQPAPGLAGGLDSEVAALEPARLRHDCGRSGGTGWRSGSGPPAPAYRSCMRKAVPGSSH